MISSSSSQNWWKVWERRKEQAPKWEPPLNEFKWWLFQKESTWILRSLVRVNTQFWTLSVVASVNWLLRDDLYTTFPSPSSSKIKASPPPRKGKYWINMTSIEKIIHTHKSIHPCNILPLCVNHVPTDGWWYQGFTTAVGAAANVWGKPCKRSWHFSVIHKRSNFQVPGVLGSQRSHIEQWSKCWNVEWRTYHTKSHFKVGFFPRFFD